MSDVSRRRFLGGLVAGGAGTITLLGGAAEAREGIEQGEILLAQAGEPLGTGAEVMDLPQVQKTGGMALLEALDKRGTVRSYSDRELSKADISSILWACTGVNRSSKKKRTTPSAVAAYPVDVYVTMAQGTYLFNPLSHQLERVLSEDLRKKAALQPSFKKAPMLILYVANTSRIGIENCAVEIGCMCQNVYLQAAASGMGSCIFALVKDKKINEALSLKDKDKFLWAQSVGYLA